MNQEKQGTGPGNDCGHAAARKIPFYQPCVGEEEKTALARVIDSKQLTQGPEVEAFEREAAEILGAPYGHECVAVSSATAAIFMLLKAFIDDDSISAGQTIGIPTMTFCATINAVIAANLYARLMDVSYLNGCSDDASVPGYILVTFAGIFPELKYWWDEPLIWDQAHSFQPAAYRENSVWSFYSNKNIGCGEGGLIGVGKRLAERLRAMRDHGRVDKYEVEYPGSLNFRMTEIQAALLREQIKKLPWIMSRKRRISQIYREIMGQDPNIILPPEECTHLFWIRIPGRDAVKKRLEENSVLSVETSIHYKPLHQMEAYKSYAHGDFPVADRIAAETLSLPFYPDLSDDQAHIVAWSVREAMEEAVRDFDLNHKPWMDAILDGSNDVKVTR